MSLKIRPIERADYAGWRPLWNGYNRFYGRQGPSALPENISEATWERFFFREEPVHALVAEQDGRVIGIAHFLFHRSTTRLTDVCYLQDLFGCNVVGLRIDNFNLRSQKAIEALGAKKDGVIRHYRARRDGTASDTHIYSIVLAEWPDVERHLELRLKRHSHGGQSNVR